MPIRTETRHCRTITDLIEFAREIGFVEMILRNAEDKPVTALFVVHGEDVEEIIDVVEAVSARWDEEAEVDAAATEPMATACYVWQDRAFCCVPLADVQRTLVRPQGDWVSFTGPKRAPQIAAALAPLEGQVLRCEKCGRGFTVSTTLNERQTSARVTFTPVEVTS